MRDFILTLLICSVSMSALGLLLMAATPLLAKRYTAKTRYYLWLIIVIGLLTPVHPPRFLRTPVIEVNIEAPALSGVSPVDTGYVVLTPEARLSGVTPAEAAPFLLRFSPRQLVTALWAAGALLFLMCHAARHIRFTRAVRRWSEPVTDGGALALLQDLKERLGVKPRVGLLLCPNVSTPMAMGLIRRRVLLPSMEYDGDELRYILTHELIHIRRRDLWYRALTLLATAMHWFNPLVYWMASRIDLLSEISCDSELVRGADADGRMRYTETIIGVVKRRSRMRTALSTGFYSSADGMKARISSIMDTGKKRAGAALICAVLVITLVPGSAFAITVPPEAAPVTLTADTLGSVLSRHERGDNTDASTAEPISDEEMAEQIRTSAHPVMEGEIDMDEAIAIAKAAIPRYLQQLVVRGDYVPVGMSTSSADLRQFNLALQDDPEAKIDPKHDYWELNFRGASVGTSSVYVMIHAETGLITEVIITGLPVAADAQLSPERMLSGYMEDLGAGGSPPGGEYAQAAGELTGVVSVAKDIAGGAAEAQLSLTLMNGYDSFEESLLGVSEPVALSLFMSIAPPDSQLLP